MRRPHRNIEIFSMSVLDMFASALGAFIMCSVILFPYWNHKEKTSKALAAAKVSLRQEAVDLKTTQHRVREIEEKIRRQEPKVREAQDNQASLNVCKQGLNQCQVAVTKNFLLVEIQWQVQNVSVELHVIDPAGSEFYWAKSNRNGHDFPAEVPPNKARLSAASRSTGQGGIQVWIDPEVRAGLYKVYYVMQRPPSQDIMVTGTIYDRMGKKTLTNVLPLGQRNSQSSELRVRAADLRIAADGTLKVERF